MTPSQFDALSLEDRTTMIAFLLTQRNIQGYETYLSEEKRKQDEINARTKRG